MDFILPYNWFPSQWVPGMPSKWALSKDMEQDEKQILCCKLPSAIGRAQRRRKVTLWELGVSNERLPAACPPPGDVWGCARALVCPKHSHSRGMPKEQSPWRFLLHLESFSSLVPSHSRAVGWLPVSRKDQVYPTKSLGQLWFALISWQRGWGGAKRHSISLPTKTPLQRRKCPLLRRWSHSLGRALKLEEEM